MRENLFKCTVRSDGEFSRYRQIKMPTGQGQPMLKLCYKRVKFIKLYP